MAAEILKTNIAECYVKDGVLFTHFTVEELLLDELKIHTAAVRTAFADVLPLPAVVYSRNMKVA